jgi:dipeptidyl aminopeptidase/acylaminoacyl peptidase
VFAEDGDIFFYDHRGGTRRRLTRTTEPETNPRFTFDGKSIYFTRANNLYLLALDDEPALTQLTDIRTAGGAGGAATAQAGARAATGDAQTRGTDSQEMLKKEERELLEAVRERAEKREADERKRKAQDERKPFQLAANQTVTSLVLAPDASYIVATIAESDTKTRNTIVPNYVTESAYAETIPSRNKVGDVQARTRLALINAKSGEVKYVEHGQRTGDKRVEVAPQVQQRTEVIATPPTQTGAQTTQQSGQQSPPTQGATQQQQTRTQQQGTQTEIARDAQTQSVDRAVQLFQIQWSDDGRRAAMLARSADNKDRWVMLLDSATAKTRVLATEHNDAWTGGPGAFTLGWLPDNKTVYFQSEASGFAHLYTVSTDEGSTPRQLTSGEFEVSDVRLAMDKQKFYFTSSEGSFFERHLYSMPTDGGTRTRLTTMSGNNAAEVSPDGSTLAVVRSYSNSPPELYLQETRAGTEPKRITTSPTAEWSAHKWVDPQIINFKAQDGATVYARLYKPATTRRARREKSPAVIFVHGAGYLQNVHKWWSTYYREYMFHHLLVERGYTVLDIDYRGSAGYGRDWRTGIYRFMGGKDLTDHTDGASYLAREHNVDPKRIGIYGGSYGGFITFMAMFTTPDVFAAGAALRPVTDWAHYNHPYTANILNLPQEDREAYERSSPIYHAQGLKGALLICHGMVDTNVHFQDSVRLVQRLIELRKENWELAVYPVEDHAFERADSWADEYKRILKLFEENLQPRDNRQARAARRGR